MEELKTTGRRVAQEQRERERRRQADEGSWDIKRCDEDEGERAKE